MEQEKIFCICQPGKAYIRFIIVMDVLLVIFAVIRYFQGFYDDIMLMLCLAVGPVLVMGSEYKYTRLILLNNGFIYKDLFSKKRFQYGQIKKVLINDTYKDKKMRIVVEGERSWIKITSEYKNYEIVEQFFRVNMPDKVKEHVPF